MSTRFFYLSNPVNKPLRASENQHRLSRYIGNQGASVLGHPLLETLAAMTSPFKVFCCQFHCMAHGCGNFGSGMTPEGIELRCRICQASCTFVATKLRFVSTKVTCRLLPHRSDFSLFRLAKKVQETNFTKGLLYDDSKDQVH